VVVVFFPENQSSEQPEAARDQTTLKLSLHQAEEKQLDGAGSAV
jgi:hypothetical protein